MGYNWMMNSGQGVKTTIKVISVKVCSDWTQSKFPSFLLFAQIRPGAVFSSRLLQPLLWCVSHNWLTRHEGVKSTCLLYSTCVRAAQSQNLSFTLVRCLRTESSPVALHKTFCCKFQNWSPAWSPFCPRWGCPTPSFPNPRWPNLCACPQLISPQSCCPGTLLYIQPEHTFGVNNSCLYISLYSDLHVCIDVSGHYYIIRMHFIKVVQS